MAENAVGDNARDLIELVVNGDEVIDGKVMDVEDDIAVVGDAVFSVEGGAAELHNLSGDIASGHGDDFNGDGKAFP